MEHLIQDIDAFLQRYETVCPLSAGKAVAQGQGAYLPMHLLRRGIIWSWLAWQAHTPFEKISTKLLDILQRAYYYYSINSNFHGSRSVHDSFLIQAAILSGSPDAAEEAALFVKDASPLNGRDQFTESWTGILKAAILGRREEEVIQLEILKRGKPLTVFPSPPVGLVTSFVDRNWGTFGTSVASALDSFLSLESQRGLTVTRSANTFSYDFRNVDDYSFWPWVTASFAKLAHAFGCPIQCDPFWLPPGLIEATTSRTAS